MTAAHIAQGTLALLVLAWFGWALSWDRWAFFLVRGWLTRRTIRKGMAELAAARDDLAWARNATPMILLRSST